MATLSAHLRQPEQHGRLPFHPDCPICRRERLSGTRSSKGLATRRAQAALVAGLLAASAAAPTAVFAQQAEQETEGSVAPEQVAGDDTAQSPEFDPGGESTDLPFETPPEPQTEGAPDPDSGDSDPLEHEPVTDVDAPLADAGDELGQAGVQQPTPSPTPTATVAPAPVPAQTESGGETPPTSVPEAEAPAAPLPETDSAPKTVPAAKPGRKRDSDGPKTVGQDRAQTVAPRPVASETPAATSERSAIELAQAPTVPAATPVAHRAAATVAGRPAAERGRRFHVVRSGESLWSIAKDLLGNDASMAAVAREVSRLWELNKTRIGTGDPDLVITGTRLTLR